MTDIWSASAPWSLSAPTPKIRIAATKAIITMPVMYLTVLTGLPPSLALRFSSAVFTEEVLFFLDLDASASARPSTEMPSRGVMLSAG